MAIKRAPKNGEPDKSGGKPAKAPKAAKPAKPADGAKPAKPAKDSHAAAFPGESREALVRRARRVSSLLRNLYGKKGTALHSRNAFELIVATALSAQSTDDNVNRVTPGLFARFPTPTALAAANPEEVEKLIFQTGFYRAKTKSIIGLARELGARFGGEVPESMGDLTSLPGVGRKTANLVRGMVYGHPALIVDTHFKRLAQRLGLADTDDPAKVEHQVAELLPPAEWTEFSNSLIWHGRAICTARKPDCPNCPALPDCPTGQTNVGGGA